MRKPFDYQGRSERQVEESEKIASWCFLIGLLTIGVFALLKAAL